MCRARRAVGRRCSGGLAHYTELAFGCMCRPPELRLLVTAAQLLFRRSALPDRPQQPAALLGLSRVTTPGGRGVRLTTLPASVSSTTTWLSPAAHHRITGFSGACHSGRPKHHRADELSATADVCPMQYTGKHRCSLLTLLGKYR